MISCLRLNRNNAVRPAAPETRVPAPRVTQVFLQLLLVPWPSLHEQGRHYWEPLQTLEILLRSGRSIVVTICDRSNRVVFASFRFDTLPVLAISGPARDSFFPICSPKIYCISDDRRFILIHRSIHFQPDNFPCSISCGISTYICDSK